MAWSLSERPTTPRSTIYTVSSNRRPKYSPKILQKLKDMKDVRAHVSTKFQTQISSVAEELKKRNVRGVDGISNTVHPRSILEREIDDPNLHQKFHKTVQRWIMNILMSPKNFAAKYFLQMKNQKREISVGRTVFQIPSTPRSILNFGLAIQMYAKYSEKNVIYGKCRDACLHEILWPNKFCRGRTKKVTCL